MNKFVITGGACVGKTTMINELKRRGYPVVGETSRIIIDSEQVHEKMNPTYKGVFPWIDNFKFQEMVIKLQVAMEANLADMSGESAFLDRSLVDGLAYSKIWGNPEVDGLRDLIKNSNYKKVFFLERLDFYEQDEQRQESEEVNIKVHEELRNVYTELGFDVVCVPALPIDERVEFIIENIKDEVDLVDAYNQAKNALYEHVGFKEDWVVYPIDDCRDMYWQLFPDFVGYADTERELEIQDGNYYSDDIYTQRFYSKHVYEGEQFTMIFCDPGVDGMKWFRVFDNDKRREYDEQ